MANPKKYSKRSSKKVAGSSKSCKSYGTMRRKKQPMIAYGFANPRNELKYFNTAVGSPTTTDGSVTNSLTATCVNIIPLGPGINQREGRQVNNSYLDVRGYLEPKTKTASASSSMTYARLLIFIDKSTNAVPTAPTAQDVLDEKAAIFTPATTASWVFAQYNVNFRNRFKILIDKTFKMGTGAAAGQFGERQHAFQMKIPLNFKTQYSDAPTGGVPSPDAIAGGAIWIAWVGDDAASSMTDQPQMSIASRLRYYE